MAKVSWLTYSLVAAVRGETLHITYCRRMRLRGSWEGWTSAMRAAKCFQERINKGGGGETGFFFLLGELATDVWSRGSAAANEVAENVEEAGAFQVLDAPAFQEQLDRGGVADKAECVCSVAARGRLIYLVEEGRRCHG